MILTEEEARKKWCPMVRHSDSGTGGSYNRPNTQPYTCIASECMMWRQHDQRESRDMDGRTLWVDRGYCGLAVKPKGVE
jgi:hypothetical protein